MKKTLNVGAGELTYEFYPNNNYKCTNFDQRALNNIDIVGDARDLNCFDLETFDMILASDIIEHFPIKDTVAILEEWARVLKPNGIIEFRLPNLAAICKHYADTGDAKRVSWLLYGGQDYEGNFHYVCFDRNLFKEECKKVGLEEVSYSEEGFNMIIRVQKGKI